MAPCYVSESDADITSYSIPVSHLEVDTNPIGLLDQPLSEKPGGFHQLDSFTLNNLFKSLDKKNR